MIPAELRSAIQTAQQQVGKDCKCIVSMRDVPVTSVDGLAKCATKERKKQNILTRKPSIATAKTANRLANLAYFTDSANCARSVRSMNA